MADGKTLVLESLRHGRGQLDRIDTRLDELTLRTGHIERAAADHSVQLAEVDARVDRIDARVTRIDQRLDLVET